MAIPEWNIGTKQDAQASAVPANKKMTAAEINQLKLVLDKVALVDETTYADLDALEAAMPAASTKKFAVAYKNDGSGNFWIRLSQSGNPSWIPIVVKRTDKPLPSGTYTVQQDDVFHFLKITAPCTVIVPNGLPANMDFQGIQVGGSDTDVLDFVPESGGTLNVAAVFQKKTETTHSFWGIRTAGSDVASLTGTLKLVD